MATSDMKKSNKKWVMLFGTRITFSSFSCLIFELCPILQSYLKIVIYGFQFISIITFGLG
ncbi:hypothetical protein Ahy_B05g078782 isoform A [Arachis hypogaea]|uniref:Uncharacterized protein n=1 Tax=Arachis hypogaea TaxID=3818 RepID=A0A444Z808_ARAHY|nr:hypothetical protein Ahy_B05g078782 isoform A [Arachis hypogaea]